MPFKKQSQNRNYCFICECQEYFVITCFYRLDVEIELSQLRVLKVADEN